MLPGVYSPRVIQERLKRVERVLGCQPTYYSQADMDRNNADLIALKDEDSGSLKRALTPDEIAYIRNERALITCDYGHYQKYTTIIGWDGRKVRYVPNIAQRILNDLRGEMEEQGFSIEFLNLKARRLGVSTDEEIATAHRVQCWSNVSAIVASADPEMSGKMSQMMEINWNNMPWYLMPRVTRYNVGELIEFGDQGSGVSIQAGSQLKGIGRGGTPTVVHLSEVSFYKNPEELIEASLLKAIIPHPMVLVMFETTAAGRFGWTYDTWKLSKENWPNSRLRPVFLPWYVGSDIYPSETWIKQFPIPVGWHPADLTMRHAEQARIYVQSNEILRKYLGEHWTMPLAQMWWWEFNYREAKEKKLLAKFLAEIAADDESAFQTGNIPCFDVEVIAEHRQRTRQPSGVYGFRGVDIPHKMRVLERDINPNFAPISVRAQWNRVMSPMDIQFVPVKWNSNQSHLGRLLVWEHPEPEGEYGVGLDASKGVGKDRAVENVLRKGDLYHNDSQVALFSSPFIDGLDLVPITMGIATYYSTFRNGMKRQCRLAIETSEGNGATTQTEMQKLGWSNFHPWMRMAAKGGLRLADSQTIGWQMLEWSRRLLMNWLTNYVEDMRLDINAASTVSELETLERDSKKQKMKASYGAFDDEIMSLGIILVSMHIMEILRNGMPDRRKNQTISKEFLRYKPPLSAVSIPDAFLNRTTVDDSYSQEASIDIDTLLRGR